MPNIARMESQLSFNPGDGCRATEPRLLVMHPLCQPTEFTDPALARRFAVRMKRHGFAKVDVYEFDPLAGGWRKVDMS